MVYSPSYATWYNSEESHFEQLQVIAAACFLLLKM